MNSNDELPLAEHLKRQSHRICQMILNSDVDRIDIEIQINTLRNECMDRAPEKVELFDAIYGARFNRLWDQWEADRPREARGWEPDGGGGDLCC